MCAKFGYSVRQIWLQCVSNLVTVCIKFGYSVRQIWLQCVPHIQFMTPCTDVCQHCENYRVLISKVITESDKLTLTQQFKEHVDLAQKERQYYLDSMKKAEESIKSASDRPSYCHYAFDFAQMLQVPYHARQVGPLYFKFL